MNDLLNAKNRVRRRDQSTTISEADFLASQHDSNRRSLCSKVSSRMTVMSLTKSKRDATHQRGDQHWDIYDWASNHARPLYWKLGIPVQIPHTLTGRDNAQY